MLVIGCTWRTLRTYRKYEGLNYSGDVADAAYLAHLLRLGLLAKDYIYPREQRGARDLSHKRQQLVRYRTTQILSIEGMLMRQTGARAEERGGQTVDG